MKALKISAQVVVFLLLACRETQAGGSHWERHWRLKQDLSAAQLLSILAVGEKAYVGTNGEGVLQLDVHSQKVTRLEGTAYWGTIYGFARRGDEVWAATSRGIRSVAPKVGVVFRYALAEDPVHFITAQDDHLAWIDKNGVQVARADQPPRQMGNHLVASALGGEPTALAMHSSHLWLGQQRDVSCTYDVWTAHYSHYLGNSSVNALSVDPAGFAWVGTDDGLVYIPTPRALMKESRPHVRYLNDSTWSTTRGPKATRVTALAHQGSGSFVVAVSGTKGGLFHGNSGGLNPVDTGRVYSVLEDPLGGLCIQGLSAVGTHVWMFGAGGVAALDAPIITARSSGYLALGTPSGTTLQKRALSERFSLFRRAYVPLRSDRRTMTVNGLSVPLNPPSMEGMGSVGIPMVGCGRRAVRPTPLPPPAPTGSNGHLWTGGLALLLGLVAQRVWARTGSLAARGRRLHHEIRKRLAGTQLSGALELGPDVLDLLVNELERLDGLLRSASISGSGGVQAAAQEAQRRGQIILGALEELLGALIMVQASGTHCPEGGWAGLAHRLNDLASEIRAIRLTLFPGKK
jgi:hypothetical protein